MTTSGAGSSVHSASFHEMLKSIRPVTMTIRICARKPCVACRTKSRIASVSLPMRLMRCPTLCRS